MIQIVDRKVLDVATDNKNLRGNRKQQPWKQQKR